MKLYLKQKLLSIGDTYDIYDENDNVVYQVTSQLISVRHRKFLKDINGNLLYVIKRKIIDILPKYIIEDSSENQVAVLQKKFSLRTSFNISGTSKNYEIKGDFMAWHWDLLEDGEVIATISKKIIHLADSYYLDIKEGEDAALVAAFVIAIDNLYHNGNR